MQTVLFPFYCLCAEYNLTVIKTIQLEQKIMATISLFDPRTKGMSKTPTLYLEQMLAEQTTVFFSCVWRYLFANHCRHPPPPVGRPHNTLAVWRSSTPSNIGALSSLFTLKSSSISHWTQRCYHSRKWTKLCNDVQWCQQLKKSLRFRKGKIRN